MYVIFFPMVVLFKQMMYVSLNSAAAVRSILASGNGGSCGELKSACAQTERGRSVRNLSGHRHEWDSAHVFVHWVSVVESCFASI